ncbi:hypothetical protein BDY21DRAFT_341094 [Lineolata rhizophorae]|uniref:C2H2-type domain-containing protein n=1 Tax=Lineolata rhizophorae TaxID=578093 RepID=A0A6A6P4J6_9PEZI|nr:hypothetical protein BDY21DRAFT_341094 [Lineolata rhizophorae]
MASPRTESFDVVPSYTYPVSPGSTTYSLYNAGMDDVSHIAHSYASSTATPGHSTTHYDHFYGQPTQTYVQQSGTETRMAAISVTSSSPTGAEGEAHSTDPPPARGSRSKARFICKHPDCIGTGRGDFRRSADLERHNQCVHHADSMPKLDCPVKNCGRVGQNGFKRPDHLTEHRRNFHRHDIPKRRRGDKRKSEVGIKREEDYGSDEDTEKEFKVEDPFDADKR